MSLIWSYFTIRSQWVYENTNGNLKTFETREWVRELGVKQEYIF